MATLIQYGQVGKPVKMFKLPIASAKYEGVVALVGDALYRCINTDGKYDWVANTPVTNAFTTARGEYFVVKED